MAPQIAPAALISASLLWLLTPLSPGASYVFMIRGTADAEAFLAGGEWPICTNGYSSLYRRYRTSLTLRSNLSVLHSKDFTPVSGLY